MRKSTNFALMILSSLLLFGCSEKSFAGDDNGNSNGNTEEPQVEEDGEFDVFQVNRTPWFDSKPVAGASDFSVTHSAQTLSFFGWSLEEDAVINLTFPESTEKYNRAILTYRMGGLIQGPADWDMTTQIMVLDKESGEYYEIARAFTPYGGSFNSAWNKVYYLDVTEYLPMLTGDTEFRVFYGGFDATEFKAHTVKMTFDFYTEAKSKRAQTIYHTKIYDSRNDHNGYRGWHYGSSVYPIESDKYMGLRTFTVPEGVKSLLMKINITGHGMEQGTFPDRKDYFTKNAAEFDENTYDVLINGESWGIGDIYYDNSNTYPQAGTYRYDRANWGPGLPANTHYWQFKNLPEDRTISIDLNLERYISPDVPGVEEGDEEYGKSIAYYIVQVDIFGLDGTVVK